MDFKDLYKASESLDSYYSLFEKLAKEGMDREGNSNSSWANYIHLNWKRTRRVLKQHLPNDDLIFNIELKQTTVFVITEQWCGDSVFSLGPLQLFSQSIKDLSIRIIYREDNESIMNKYLTNGNKSIPKMIRFDNQTEVGTWGPRPQKLNKFIEDYKSNEDFSKDELKKEIQMWYNNDKGIEVYKELAKFLK